MKKKIVLELGPIRPPRNKEAAMGRISNRSTILGEKRNPKKIARDACRSNKGRRSKGLDD